MSSLKSTKFNLYLSIFFQDFFLLRCENLAQLLQVNALLFGSTRNVRNNQISLPGDPSQIWPFVIYRQSIKIIDYLKLMFLLSYYLKLFSLSECTTLGVLKINGFYELVLFLSPCMHDKLKTNI